jgi:hypothetical protein
MGHDKKETTQTTGSMPRESSQVGTHGDTGTKDWTQGQGSQDKGQGQYRAQGQPMDQDTTQGGWNDRAQRPMQQGDETRPAEPSGTSPLDKDDQYADKSRPGQQNR